MFLSSLVFLNQNFKCPKIWYKWLPQIFFIIITNRSAKNIGQKYHKKLLFGAIYQHFSNFSFKLFYHFCFFVNQKFGWSDEYCEIPPKIIFIPIEEIKTNLFKKASPPPEKKAIFFLGGGRVGEHAILLTICPRQ